MRSPKALSPRFFVSTRLRASYPVQPDQQRATLPHRGLSLCQLVVPHFQPHGNGFDDPEFHRREMALLASRNATQEDFDHVISAIRLGQVDVDRLITHRATLAQMATDLPRWAADKAGLIKAMVGLD